MRDRRRATIDISAAEEDAALFARGVGPIAVEVLPQLRRSERGDLVVRGFVNRSLEIEVVFAGRRVKEVGPFEKWLATRLQKARRAAAAVGRSMPDIESVRCPVKVEGAWRPRFKRDDAGLETRSYHLIAARWSIVDDDGQAVTFGWPVAI